MFESIALERFKNRTYQHLIAIWPEECKSLGEEAVRASIQEGLTKARSYGLNSELDVARYIDLIYTLGDSFDCNPELPWAGAILRDDSLAPGQRLDALYDEAEEKLENGQI